MADPTGISVAFDDDALEATPTWTRLDEPGAGYGVTGWSIQRGRSDEFQKIGASTPSLSIFDRGGYFDPTNPGSPFYDSMAGETKLDPMKQLAVCLWNPITDTWHRRFRGFTSDLLYEMDVTGRFGTVTLDTMDAFGYFAKIEMMPGKFGGAVPFNSTGDIYYVEDAALTACQTRINQALDDLGWPSSMREIFTGNVGLQPTVYARRDPFMSVLLDTGDAEFPNIANIWPDADGNIVFHGRYARFNAEDAHYHISHWKAGGEPQAAADDTVAPITGLSFRRSEADIINQALALPAAPGVTDAEIAAQLVEDTASVTKYGVHAVSWPDLQTRNGRGPTTAVEETKLFATYYKENYKKPRTRVTEIRFRPRSPEHFSSPAIWALICGVEIGDIIELTTVHPRGGGFDEDFFVESIAMDCAPGRVDSTSGEQVLPDLELRLGVAPRADYDVNPFGSQPDF